MNPFLHTAKQHAIKSISLDFPWADLDALARAFEAGVNAGSDLRKMEIARAMKLEPERQERMSKIVLFETTDAMIDRIEAANNAAMGEVVR